MGVTLVDYWGLYFGIVEKKMETTIIMDNMGEYRWIVRTKENQIEKVILI